MNPVALKADAGAALLASGIVIGWVGNGWRLYAELANRDTDAATARADSAGTALATLTAVATIFREQATRACSGQAARPLDPVTATPTMALARNDKPVRA